MKKINQAPGIEWELQEIATKQAIEVIEIGVNSYPQHYKDVDYLIQYLQTTPLDPMFEKYGNFVQRKPEWIDYINHNWDTKKIEKHINPYRDTDYVCIWGNFWGDAGCCFRIITKNFELVDRLEKLIKENQAREDYQRIKEQYYKGE